MGKRRLLSLASFALVGAVMIPALTGCAASTQITQWEMNEPVGATVMKDTSGSGINGAIGNEVQVGSVREGRTGYGAPWVGNGPGATVHRGKLVVVNDSRLNPGTQDYVVATTFRHVITGTNVLQKGQAGLPGGYFKIETHLGHVTCFFEGANGVISSVVSPKTYNDNVFHAYRCERKAAFGVRLSVDNVVVGTNPKQPGNISNNQPFVIGGKYACDQTTVECDYFSGMIDRVAVARA
jgi:hypothetical protein